MFKNFANSNVRYTFAPRFGNKMFNLKNYDMEKETKSFGGFAPSKVESANNTFDCLLDDSERIELVSKEEFHHTEDGLNFDYRYVITAILFDDGNGGDKWYVTLQLVPSPQSLCERVAERVCECCGVDRDEMTHTDIADYGYSINVATETTTEEDPQHLIDLAATITSVADSLRGFILDKHINWMTTGWDLLQECVNGKER